MSKKNHGMNSSPTTLTETETNRTNTEKGGTDTETDTETNQTNTEKRQN